MTKYTVKLPYSLKSKILKEVKRITANGPIPWIEDPRGYFLIRINRKKKEIEVGFCERGNIVQVIITGKKPEEIYYAIFKEGLVTKFDHAAYLGKELEKAYIALKTGAKYVQDSDLELKF
ncbi:TPA: DUF4346 domain-containing protein [archaeon]|uniref:DUF4346 domain-containing protein n=1 Tax=Candidatus Naiadarchaeum limnaeum TaxID=2756139 RepID=A0A832V9H8_9ARCH|nr:DUF4346 domain-containing protein [Candidatus Naiadarchaeum limnaeum]